MRKTLLAAILLVACRALEASTKGVKIAYVSGGAITVADPDGENATVVGSGLPKGDIRELACSRDGKSIACSLGMMGTDLHVVPLDGSAPVHLSKRKSGMTGWSQPAWSPDGKRVVCAVGDMFDLNLWIVERDGSNPRNLTN